MGDDLELRSASPKLRLEYSPLKRTTVQQVEHIPDLHITPAQAQDLATVNAVFDDWNFSTEDVFKEMLQKLSNLPPEQRAKFIDACTKAAHKLSESRVDDRLRTYLAVMGYIVAIISAFFKTLSDGPSKMTAFAICLVWLVPAVLLSSIVGGFMSRRSGLWVIYELRHELQHKLGEEWSISDPNKLLCESTIHSPISSSEWEPTNEPLDKALPYVGGNYSYRPSKHIFPSNAPADRRHEFVRERSTVELYVYSTLPVVIAAGCAMALSCVTPTIGLGTVTQMGFLLSWFLSVIVTAMLGTFLTGKYHWYAILINDAVITLIIAGFIIAAFIGRRHLKAYIEFNFQDQLMMLAKSRWPILVALGVGGQVFILLLMRWGNAQGVMLFSRDESVRELYFRRIRIQGKEDRKNAEVQTCEEAQPGG
ncbi:hypothetical protein K440DRAFT_637818 [Wilcoxina mikolae CBS 423.85]|nr:hypothetical protein K440DRAFT_637818 [Wilcoxina mikolae CBS 423.85]